MNLWNYNHYDRSYLATLIFHAGFSPQRESSRKAKQMKCFHYAKASPLGTNR